MRQSKISLAAAYLKFDKYVFPRPSSSSSSRATVSLVDCRSLSECHQILPLMTPGDIILDLSEKREILSIDLAGFGMFFFLSRLITWLSFGDLPGAGIRSSPAVLD